MSAEVVRITDPESGSSAEVLVSQGFNCFRWRPVLDEGPREMLWAPPGFEKGDQRASSAGTPLLFPFPGRIGGAQFDFEGKTYELPENGSGGNAIHGFVFDKPWQITFQSKDAIEAEFQGSVDAPETLPVWPSDYKISVRYQVKGQKLLMRAICSNEGEANMPFGFGTHAYFRLPLAEGSAVEETIVHVPVDAVWALENMLPRGEPCDLGGDAAMREGLRLGEREFDTVYNTLTTSDEIVTELKDPASGRRLQQTTDDAMRCCVIYTPGHREAICLEPYTCVPDAVRLTEEGQSVGLKILAPGEAWQTEIDLAVID